MATKTLTLNKLVSSDFSEGSSWVLNKGGGGDTDVGYFVFNSLGVTSAKITNVSFKINAIETGGNNLLSENIYLNFEFGYYLGSTFAKSTSFSFSQLGVKESENQVSRTATASGNATMNGENLCIKMTVTPQSNSIGSKIIMSGFSLTVTYEIQTYTVTVNVNPSEGGTVTGVGSYTAGSNATVTAVPNRGYKFVGWSNQSGVITVTSNPYIFTVNSSTTFNAVFEKIGYIVNVLLNESESGETCTVSGTGTYYYGDTITLTATAPKNNEFAGWIFWNNSSEYIYDNPLVITLDDNLPSKVYEYNEIGIDCFTRFTGYNIQVSIVPDNSGIAQYGVWLDFDGDGIRERWSPIVHELPPEGYAIAYNEKDICGINVIPNSGYRFVKWGDGSTENPRRLSVSGDMIYTAYLELDKILNVYRSVTPQDVYRANSNIQVYRGLSKIYG